MTALPKVIIAAMKGDAMGGGFELTFACDLRIGQRGDFRYGNPEVRAGVIPGAGGTQRVTRLVGLARALDWVLRDEGGESTVPSTRSIFAAFLEDLADGLIVAIPRTCPPAGKGVSSREFSRRARGRPTDWAGRETPPLLSDLQHDLAASVPAGDPR